MATRVFREVTGTKTRFHVIVPIAASLSTYRVIEVRPLADLLGARVPSPMERYLNGRLTAALRRLPSSPAVLDTGSSLSDDAPDPADTGPSAPTLIIDGFLDDYEAGSRSLRIVELGFNHAAVTVRVGVRDKRSGQLLGAASVTAEDDRATGTTKAAIDHATDRIRAFVEAGYAR